MSLKMKQIGKIAATVKNRFRSIFVCSKPKVCNEMNEFRGPIRGFRDTGYSRKKLPGYGIFEEKFIGIQDSEK